MRQFRAQDFDEAFSAMVTDIYWQEEAHYYPRYRERYLAMLRQFAITVPEHGIDLLEIGGGQLAYLSMKLWGQDKASVADVQDVCFPGLKEHGIDTFLWNLALTEPPRDQKFDAIFFSEVIEHLPVPGYIPLSRLRSILRPGGVLLCSTPNLYRLRNIFYLMTGRPIFDYFGLPEERPYGHVLEYSAQHLAWQFERAGFSDFNIELRDFAHTPNKRGHQLLAALGAPLRRVPRYRDNLLAVARA
jgi:SAM-dependent methyltransferase